MHVNHCVKCKKQYESEEPDDYYCEECFKTHQQVIKETEEKMKNRPKRTIVSDFQKFDIIAKQKGKGGFVNIKDLDF